MREMQNDKDSEHVHMSKILCDKAVSDTRQVHTQAKNLAWVRSDLRSLALLLQNVETGFYCRNSWSNKQTKLHGKKIPV